MTNDLAEARRRRQERRARALPGGTRGLNGSAAARSALVLSKVGAAEEKRDPAGFYAGQFPTPQRITAALDIRALYGPEVDQMLGGEEPMVDEWESGVRVPTFEQVQALAELTSFPVKFFYLPPGPDVGDAFLCGPEGCERLSQ